MTTTKITKALILAAALFMVNCGDSSESTPAAPAETSTTVPPEITAPVETAPVIPEDSAEVPSITVTDSVMDTTEYSCHDSKWVPKENFDMMIVNNPQMYAMRKAPYMAYKKTFLPFLEDTVAQLHYESTRYGWYPDSTPYCLIEMIDSIFAYEHYQWFHDEENVSHDSIATEIECSDGTVHPKDEYTVYTEILNAYNEQKNLYNQLYDSLYEQSLHDIKALLDSCLNYPENFPISNPAYEKRYESYWETHDMDEDDEE